MNTWYDLDGFCLFVFAGFPKRIHSLWQIDLLHISCTKGRTRKTPALQRWRCHGVVGCCGRRSKMDPAMTTDNNGNENISNINNNIIINNNNNLYQFSPFVFGASYHGVALVSLACKNLTTLSIWAVPHELYAVSQPASKYPTFMSNLWHHNLYKRLDHCLLWNHLELKLQSPQFFAMFQNHDAHEEKSSGMFLLNF